jgi:hypothetical protein
VNQRGDHPDTFTLVSDLTSARNRHVRELRVGEQVDGVSAQASSGLREIDVQDVCGGRYGTCLYFRRRVGVGERFEGGVACSGIERLADRGEAGDDARVVLQFSPVPAVAAGLRQPTGLDRLLVILVRLDLGTRGMHAGDTAQVAVDRFKQGGVGTKRWPPHCCAGGPLPLKEAL